MKCSHIIADNKSVDVFKDPFTDQTKKSKTGKLDLVKWANGKYQTIKGENNEFSIMRTVYEDGEILLEDNFENIRERAK